MSSTAFIVTSRQYLLWYLRSTSLRPKLLKFTPYFSATWAIWQSGIPKQSVYPQLHFIQLRLFIVTIRTLSNDGIVEPVLVDLRVVPRITNQVLLLIWIFILFSSLHFIPLLAVGFFLKVLASTVWGMQPAVFCEWSQLLSFFCPSLFPVPVQ